MSEKPTPLAPHDRKTPSPTKIRVAVVDDSALCRDVISEHLEHDGDIAVVGYAEDGFAAIDLVETLAPDVVTMDMNMPGRSGLETVEHIMTRHPVPIIIVTAEPKEEGRLAFRAIESGALDVIAKASLEDDAAGESLRTLVRTLKGVPVMRRVPASSKTTPAPAGADVAMVAAAAGEGGLPSVLAFVGGLPPALGVAVVLQYPVKTELSTSLVDYIEHVAKVPVRVAAPPSIRCAPGELVLVLGFQAIFVSDGELIVSPGTPSTDQLLHSLAREYGPRSLAVVLAGKGSDGRVGVESMRKEGGVALVEEIARGSALGEMPNAALAGSATAMSIDEICEAVAVAGIR